MEKIAGGASHTENVTLPNRAPENVARESGACRWMVGLCGMRLRLYSGVSSGSQEMRTVLKRSCKTFSWDAIAQRQSGAISGVSDISGLFLNSNPTGLRETGRTLH